MIFDVNSRFIACYGESQIFIINLVTPIDKEVSFEHKCDISDVYEKIINVKLVSENETIFKCYAACKIKGQRNVAFVEIRDEIEKDRIITYLNDSDKL